MDKRRYPFDETDMRSEDDDDDITEDDIFQERALQVIKIVFTK